MNYYMICNKCGHIFQTRRSRTDKPWKQRRQCHKCWSNDLIELSHQFIIEKYKDMIIRSVISSRSDKWKDAKKILKEKFDPQVVYPIPKKAPLNDQVQGPGSQYPECFGKRFYLDQNKGIDGRICIDSDCFKGCRKRANDN